MEQNVLSESSVDFSASRMRLMDDDVTNTEMPKEGTSQFQSATEQTLSPSAVLSNLRRFSQNIGSVSKPGISGLGDSATGGSPEAALEQGPAPGIPTDQSLKTYFAFRVSDFFELYDRLPGVGKLFAPTRFWTT